MFGGDLSSDPSSFDLALASVVCGAIAAAVGFVAHLLKWRPNFGDTAAWSEVGIGTFGFISFAGAILRLSGYEGNFGGKFMLFIGLILGVLVVFGYVVATGREIVRVARNRSRQDRARAAVPAARRTLAEPLAPVQRIKENP